MSNAQKKLFLSLAVGMAGLIVFIGLIICPLINRIRIAAQECLNNQDVLAKLDQRVSLLKGLKKNYQDNQSNLLMLENAFLGPEETIGFITTLETIANQTNNFFEIKSVSSNPEDETKAAYLRLNIYLWGNFFGLLNFLANLENIPYPPYRLIEVDTLTIRKLAKEDLSRIEMNLGEGKLETVLSVKVYTQ
jgi:hypothetical protein